MLMMKFAVFFLMLLCISCHAGGRKREIVEKSLEIRTNSEKQIREDGEGQWMTRAELDVNRKLKEIKDRFKRHFSISANLNLITNFLKPEKKFGLRSSNAVKIFRENMKNFPCPLPEDILPCICVEENSGVHLYCSNINSSAELEYIFQMNFPVKDLGTLQIDSSPYLYALGDVFNGVSFKEAYFIDTNITWVSEYFLKDSIDTLETVAFVSSAITTNTFPFMTIGQYNVLSNLIIVNSRLDSLPRMDSSTLRQVVFSNGEISVLHPDTFTGLPNIETIDLTNNEVPALWPGQFAGLPNLKIIDLTNNKLQALPAGAINLPNNVFFSLSLKDNNISTVEPQAFVMPTFAGNLSAFVDLESNSISTLEEEVYGELWENLETIVLTDNPLICGCDLFWLLINSTLIHTVELGATCLDGTPLQNLNPEEYDKFCDLKQSFDAN